MNLNHGTDLLPDIVIRRALASEQSRIEAIKERALEALLDPVLTPEQRRTMRLVTPVDPLLIEDGTYYVASVNGWIAACGGWTRRKALFRNADEGRGHDEFLDPTVDPAGVRAMYTDPDFARKGLGRLVLSTALTAARLAGFRAAQLIATPTGERLYRATGWRTEDEVVVGPKGSAGVPGFLMSRAI